MNAVGPQIRELARDIDEGADRGRSWMPQLSAAKNAAAEATLRAVEQVDALLKTLGIAFTLSDLGVRESQLDWLSRTALDSMPAVFANNPAAMTSEDVKTILERRL